MKTILTPEYNSLIRIENYANQFVLENKLQFKHLDFSVESLNLIEQIIDTKIDTLTNNDHEIEKLTSYLLKTLIKGQQFGCVCINETSNEKQFIYKSSCSTQAQFDIKNHIINRIKHKRNLSVNKKSCL